MEEDGWMAGWNSTKQDMSNCVFRVPRDYICAYIHECSLDVLVSVVCKRPCLGFCALSPMKRILFVEVSLREPPLEGLAPEECSLSLCSV